MTDSHAIRSEPDPAIAEPLPAIERELERVVPLVGAAEGLREAVRYSLLSGGKRVRPLLVWHACTAAGGDPNLALPAGAAVELIHAFSLVHDDLPAMDDDDLRRGRPTLHKHAGEAMAILAGDAMQSASVRVIYESYSPEVAHGLIAALTDATIAMIDGQVYDTIGTAYGERSNDSDLDRLHLIHALKTGALLRASCMMGGLVAGADADQLERLGAYAERIGLLFQVVDDLLDATSTTEQLGKAAGKDEDAGKLTFPGVLGIEASRAEVSRLEAEAVEIAESFGDAGRTLGSIARYLARRDR